MHEFLLKSRLLPLFIFLILTFNSFMKYSRNSWFSIVLAIGLTLLLSLTGLYLLEYVVPFSKNVKGIESASNSFYQAYKGLEEAVYLNSQNIKNNIWYQTWATLIPSFWQEYSYNILANGTGSPLPGNGNSEFHRDFNKLSQAEPAQFVIGNGRLSTGSPTLTLSLKVPDISNSPDAISTSSWIVLWQLSSSWASLTSTNLITGAQINTSNFSLNLFSQAGTLLNGTSQQFNTFYTNNCTAGKECVLKISLISPIFNTISWNPRIPYLEYKLVSNPSIPLREALITTQGKSYGFRRNLEVLIPQTTTNSAFDFTVFQ